MDGARAGWLAVIWRDGALEAELAPRFPALPCAELRAVAVDMPIGLSDAGPRACDLAARRLLPRGRKSSVFAPPRRYMLGLAHAEANAQGKAREGTGLAKQSWHIGRRIAELDAALTPADQTRVFESHPELIFHRLNGGAALPRKTTREGRAARLRLLLATGLPDPSPLLDRFPRREAQPDDILDAAACALTARNILAGRARRVPDGEPPRDSRGLRMEIWY